MRVGQQVAKGKFLKVAFDKNALTRHGIILGSTGSGKTALGIGLLEQLALREVPIIAIDPKGDLGNILDVPLMGSTLASEGVRGEEIGEYGRDSFCQKDITTRAKLMQVDACIYTPGISSNVEKGKNEGGKALGIYGSSKESRSEYLKQVLSLAYGYEVGSLATPYVFLEKSVEAVEQYRHIDAITAELLISYAMQPVIKAVGGMNLDDYISENERMTLARKLTSLASSQDFKRWTEGELDVAGLLWKMGQGMFEKVPQLSIVSIAHLSEADRKFFLPIFLSELISTMRTWQGTDQLKAVLYIDECAGMVPSVSTPPTKSYLMTLLKQARAYGLGVILATQNPADLDYKALGNIGSWWVGRLQTERDRSKVKEAIQGSEGGSGSSVNLGNLLGKLEARQFVQSINGSHPVTVKSNDCLSRLSGPMTLTQIGERMEWRRWSSVNWRAGESEYKTYRRMLVAGSHCALHSMYRELNDLKYWRDMKLGEGEGAIGLANFLWRESVKPTLKKRLRIVQDDLMQNYLASAKRQLLKGKVG
jgi:hypothetical protein